MTAQDFLALNAGKPTVTQPGTAGGSGDANKIPALDSNGLIATGMLPAGLGVDTVSATATEAISAGAFVNLWLNGGILSVRNADASTTGKEANGFALSAISNTAVGVVTMRGQNSSVTGLTIGALYFLSTTTPGGSQTTTTFSAGQTCQVLGRAISATIIDFTYSGFVNT